MQVVKPREFTGQRAWDAREIARLDGVTTVRLHWTDAPYHWHCNEGEEVFVVLEGAVRMFVRLDGKEQAHELTAGDVFHAAAGDEHVAHPVGVARVLVIEREGSV